MFCASLISANLLDSPENSSIDQECNIYSSCTTASGRGMLGFKYNLLNGQTVEIGRRSEISLYYGEFQRGNSFVEITSNLVASPEFTYDTTHLDDILAACIIDDYIVLSDVSARLTLLHCIPGKNPIEYQLSQGSLAAILTAAKRRMSRAPVDLTISFATLNLGNSRPILFSLKQNFELSCWNIENKAFLWNADILTSSGINSFKKPDASQKNYIVLFDICETKDLTSVDFKLAIFVPSVGNDAMLIIYQIMIKSSGEKLSMDVIYNNLVSMHGSAELDDGISASMIDFKISPAYRAPNSWAIWILWEKSNQAVLRYQTTNFRQLQSEWCDVIYPRNEAFIIYPKIIQERGVRDAFAEEIFHSNRFSKSVLVNAAISFASLKRKTDIYEFNDLMLMPIAELEVLIVDILESGANQQVEISTLSLPALLEAEYNSFTSICIQLQTRDSLPVALATRNDLVVVLNRANAFVIRLADSSEVLTTARSLDIIDNSTFGDSVNIRSLSNGVITNDSWKKLYVDYGVLSASLAKVHKFISPGVLSLMMDDQIKRRTKPIDEGDDTFLRMHVLRFLAPFFSEIDDDDDIDLLQADDRILNMCVAFSKDLERCHDFSTLINGSIALFATNEKNADSGDVPPHDANPSEFFEDTVFWTFRSVVSMRYHICRQLCLAVALLSVVIKPKPEKQPRKTIKCNIHTLDDFNVNLEAITKLFVLMQGYTMLEKVICRDRMLGNSKSLVHHLVQSRYQDILNATNTLVDDSFAFTTSASDTLLAMVGAADVSHLEEGCASPTLLRFLQSVAQQSPACLRALLALIPDELVGVNISYLQGLCLTLFAGQNDAVWIDGKSDGDYFEYLAALYKEFAWISGVLEFTKRAIQVTPLGSASDLKLTTLWQTVFTCCDSLDDPIGAYMAIISIPDDEAKRRCIQVFVSSLAEKGGLDKLCSGLYPFIGMDDIVEETLFFKAKNCDIGEFVNSRGQSKNYYHILYSYFVFKAAFIMYTFSQRLAAHCEQASSVYNVDVLDIVSEQVRALLAAINALSLVTSEDGAWIVATVHDPTQSEFAMDFDDDANRISTSTRTLTVTDLGREYALCLAKLKVARKIPEVKEPSYQMDACSAISLFVKLFDFDAAASLCLQFDISMNAIFHGLAFQCSRNITKEAWENAQLFLSLHDGEENGFLYRKEFTEQLLWYDARAKLPHWLIESFRVWCLIHHIEIQTGGSSPNLHIAWTYRPSDITKHGVYPAEERIVQRHLAGFRAVDAIHRFQPDHCGRSQDSRSEHIAKEGCGVPCIHSSAGIAKSSLVNFNLRIMAFVSFEDLSPFTLAGITLNVEERAALQSSLIIKRTEEKFDQIVIWGKILGVNKDYYISQAWNQDEWFNKKSFYCTDLVNWLQFPDVCAEEMPLIETYTGRFMGEPAVAEGTKEDGTPASKSAITEEKRLAAMIKLIDHDVHIVPRGAYYRDSLHKLMQNNLTSGLSASDLGRLSSYLHFRPGFAVDTKLLIERGEQFQEGIDIFEPISRDEPTGVWSIQTERSGSIAILRSLLWPGYVFYHRPGQNANSSSKWGSIYFGTGQRNDNVGFML